jgi:ribonuclease T2
MHTLARALVLGGLSLTAAAAEFSYYMLSLSYAPNFCAHAGAERNARECSAGAKPFVVHGLWPQNDVGRGPERCGSARPVAADLVRSMLGYFPTESLVQHEWATHGTCTGLSPAEYFAAVRRAADSIRIPQALNEVSRPLESNPQAIENDFAQANPGIPRSGFRVSCYPDAGLQEVRICFDKSLQAQPCNGAAECTRLKIYLLPGRSR